MRNALSKIDFFRKVPEELQIHSASGSFFTIFSFVLMFFLMYSHWQSYQYAGTRQYIEMDSHQEDLLRLNFNISLLNIPCQHASVDMADHMGQQFVNITRHVRHFRLVTSKTNGNTIRSDEIIMKEENFPIWGSVSRQTHAGIHYSMPLTTKNFDDFMQKYELVLVNYYTPWCPYCKQLNPEWEKVAAQLRDHPEYSERVTLASVDCTDPQAVWLCRRAHIRAFPSMLIYVYGNTFTRYIYNGPRKAEFILQFLDLFYRRLEPDADFAEEIQDPQLVLPQKIDHQDIENLDLKKKQILNQEEDFIEGCEVSGSISINRVPGKVIFTAHSKDQSFIFSDINVSHVVNHFSFGQMKQSEHLLNSKKMFTSERFPLDGLIFLTENKHTTIEHFLNVVGFDHEEKSSSSSIIFHPVERIYEFSSSTGQTLGENLLPGVFFTYDISPLVIRVVPDYTPWYRLLTSLCAVIGGVFTIIGLLDTGVFHTINSIKKKQQLGKFH